MYARGGGVAQDDREAVKWFRLSAEQGFAEAQFSLGNHYENGQGVAQDYREAAKWSRLAAQQGKAEAQFNLGFMYDKGHGVSQDYLGAHMWYNLAASRLSRDEGKLATKNRDTVEKTLTPAQVVKAQEMAKNCEASEFKNCD
jgi:uncharacterized protein